MNTDFLKTGDIIVESIGCGHDSFWQIVKVSPKSVVVRPIEYKVTKRQIKYQSMDIEPIKDAFEGEETRRLMVTEDGRIGPIERLHWWSVWKGESLNQYSP